MHEGWFQVRTVGQPVERVDAPPAPAAAVGAVIVWDDQCFFVNQGPLPNAFVTRALPDDLAPDASDVRVVGAGFLRSLGYPHDVPQVDLTQGDYRPVLAAILSAFEDQVNQLAATVGGDASWTRFVEQQRVGLANKRIGLERVEPGTAISPTWFGSLADLAQADPASAPPPATQMLTADRMDAYAEHHGYQALAAGLQVHVAANQPWAVRRTEQGDYDVGLLADAGMDHLATIEDYQAMHVDPASRACAYIPKFAERGHETVCVVRDGATTSFPAPGACAVAVHGDELLYADEDGLMRLAPQPPTRLATHDQAFHIHHAGQRVWYGGRDLCVTDGQTSTQLAERTPAVHVGDGRIVWGVPSSTGRGRNRTFEVWSAALAGGPSRCEGEGTGRMVLIRGDEVLIGRIDKECGTSDLIWHRQARRVARSPGLADVMKLMRAASLHPTPLTVGSDDKLLASVFGTPWFVPVMPL